MAGLYIHFPFCHSKCAYCDFYSLPSRGELIDSYIEAVIAEFDTRRSEISEPFSTLYLGGGTPSIVASDELKRLCAALPLDNIQEFTIEVNPEDVHEDVVKAWITLGINRVSMGIQSLCDNELKAINRRHSAAAAIEAVKCLQRCGITNISCDLIYGLPGQSIESWQYSLNKLIALEPTHISSYCLSYEKGTALYARLLAGKLQPTDDETLKAMYDTLCATTAAAGYQHYEISNFAKEGKHSRHNSSYWNQTPYLGLGPSAHSFDGKTRRFNPSDLKAYIARQSETIVDDETPENIFNDLLITSLRTAAGLDINSITDAYRRTCLLKAARQYILSGLMEVTPDSRLIIKESAWFISDSILRDLLWV